jgi:hypothetical protein
MATLPRLALDEAELEKLGRCVWGRASRDGVTGRPCCVRPCCMRARSVQACVEWGMSPEPCRRGGVGACRRDSTCSVCTEELRVGDEVLLLPCRHAFHPDCVKPW